MNNHPYLETIRAYYNGCSTGDVELMKSTFTPDVTHYFTESEPVRGAEALATFWAGFNTSTRKSEWTVDRFMADGDEAVIEWTMISTYLEEGGRKAFLRGAEWYVFHDGKVAEIRAYYLWTEEQRESELVGFPYKERGYPVR